MKISVIVTTYNRPDALKKVLDGLLHQTRLPDEIIIADDGSIDETRLMLQSYLKHNQIRIKHVWHKDKGFRLAEIRNKAILESGSEYLVFLDGDCIPPKHFVEDHLNLAQKGYFFQGKRVIVSQKVSPGFTFSDANSILCLLRHLVFGISNSHHILRIPFFPSYTTAKLSGVRGCNMGFFKENLLSVNGFNQKFKGWGREDSEIVIRLFKYGLKRKENPFKAVCYHLWHKENTRDYLEKNNQILEKTGQQNSYVCKSGLNEFHESIKDI
ncbi:glycosyltransferase family 2 protein [Desulfobacterales bacterium HSG17]|nr:glycosyltransferase family 2 protein [Desulfobacterales bacterium HSG17]